MGGGWGEDGGVDDLGGEMGRSGNGRSGLDAV